MRVKSTTMLKNQATLQQVYNQKMIQQKTKPTTKQKITARSQKVFDDLFQFTFRN